MPAPLESGDTWTEDPAGNVLAHRGRTICTHMIAESDPKKRALVKRPADNVPPVEIYTIGMERIAYELATLLELPVPVVYLEDVGGYPSSVQERIPNSRSFRALESAPTMATEIRNRNMWPLGALFDVWMANTDRRDVNLLMETHPRGAAPNASKGCTSWLIDHGCCGLWPAAKLPDRRPEEVPEDPDVVSDGMLRREGDRAIHDHMPVTYRKALKNVLGADRVALVDQVRAISNDAIEQAVRGVPPRFVNRGQADATIAFLKGRRDGLDTVLDEHWCG